MVLNHGRGMEGVDNLETSRAWPELINMKSRKRERQENGRRQSEVTREQKEKEIDMRRT